MFFEVETCLRTQYYSLILCKDGRKQTRKIQIAAIETNHKKHETLEEEEILKNNVHVWTFSVISHVDVMLLETT
jgi:hypothetical protein